MSTEYASSRARSLPLAVRCLLIAIGFVAIALGVLGIVLPLLPTTPFLLLAAACFARSSERCYGWLLNMPVFGRYIRDYQAGKGIPVRVKLTALTVLWATILTSVIWIVPVLFVKALLIVIAGVVTTHIVRLPNRRHGAA
ncbi:MAG TPA: YbaN family protein [Nitrococcus sp.]|nr:YbaN family protein [Nitrococcus sp.]